MDDQQFAMGAQSRARPPEHFGSARRRHGNRPIQQEIEIASAERFADERPRGDRRPRRQLPADDDRTVKDGARFCFLI